MGKSLPLGLRGVGWGGDGAGWGNTNLYSSELFPWNSFPLLSHTATAPPSILQFPLLLISAQTLIPIMFPPPLLKGLIAGRGKKIGGGGGGEMGGHGGESLPEVWVKKVVCKRRYNRRNCKNWLFSTTLPPFWPLPPLSPKTLTLGNWDNNLSDMFL